MDVASTFERKLLYQSAVALQCATSASMVELEPGELKKRGRNELGLSLSLSDKPLVHAPHVVLLSMRKPSRSRQWPHQRGIL
jgi:hypothetical protein